MPIAASSAAIAASSVGASVGASDAIVVALIAAVVSLAVAALSNFGAESFKRHCDAVALAAGLAGELKSHAAFLPEIQAGWGRLQKLAESGQFQFVPNLKPTSPVFDASVARLGALGPELAEEVAFVYSGIQAFRMMMSWTAEGADTAEKQAASIKAALRSIERVEGRANTLIEALHKRARSRFLSLRRGQ